MQFNTKQAVKRPRRENKIILFVIMYFLLVMYLFVFFFFYARLILSEVDSSLDEKYKKVVEKPGVIFEYLFT